MTIKTKHLPPNLARRMREYARHRMFQRVTLTLALTIGVYFLLLLIGMLVDRFTFMSVDERTAMNVLVHVITAAVLVGGMGLVWWRRPGPRQVAYEMESRIAGGAEERYITVESLLGQMRLASAGSSAAGAGGATATAPAVTGDSVAGRLLEQLRGSAATLAANLRARQLTGSRTFTAARIAALLVAVLCALAISLRDYQGPLMLARFYTPGLGMPRASFVGIDLNASDQVIGKGGEVVVTATITDDTPEHLRWLMDLLGATPEGATITVQPSGADEEDDAARRVPMVRIQRDMFLFTQSQLDQSFDYRVRVGNNRTQWQQIEVVAQPKIQNVRVVVDPPDYATARLEPEPYTNFSQPIRMLLNSTATLQFGVDQPVAELRLDVAEAEQPIEVEQWDPATRQATHTFTVDQPMEVSITAVNPQGFANVERHTVRFAILEDLPPRVTLNYPPSQINAVASELVPIDAVIADDLGIAEVMITYIVNPDPMREDVAEQIDIPMEEQEPQELQIDTAFDLAETGAGPGDTVVLQIRARDSAGGSATSRQVIVHIVPFTRGAHETRRITALRFIAETLGQLAEQPADVQTRQQAIDIDAEAWDQIITAARGVDVPLPNDPSVEALLELIELEHYLTENPADQADVRAIHGIVAAAVEPAFFESPQALAAYRQQTLSTLAGDIVPPIARYRQAKNAVWRLFGMRAEAARISAELSGLEPDANLVSISRRARLYLDALQDLGDDLINLARNSGQLDQEQLNDLFGQINTAGFFMTRGPIARRVESAQQVGGLLTQVLTLTRTAVPELIVAHNQARQKLHDQLDAARQRVEAAAAADDTDVTEAAYQWFDVDGLLLERNPFTPNAARSHRLYYRDRIAATAVPETAPPAAIAAEADAWHALARRWQHVTVAAGENLTPAERLIEHALIEAESMLAAGDTRDAQRMIQQAMAVDLAADARIDATWAADETTLALRRTLPDVADRFYRPLAAANVVDRLQTLLQRLAATDEAMTAMVDALNAGRTEAITDRARTLSRRIQTQNRATDLVQSAIIVANTLVPGTDPATGPRDAVNLRLIDILGRYRQRVGGMAEPLERLAAGSESPEDIGSVQVALSRGQYLHKTLTEQISALAQAYAQGELEVEQIVGFDTMAMTQNLAVSTRTGNVGESGRQRARELLTSSPEA